MTTPPRPASRWPAIAAVLAVGSLACTLATVVLRLPDRDVETVLVGPDLVLGSIWPIVGALVVRAQPRNPVGWVLLVPALLGPYQLFAWYAAQSGGAGWLGGVSAWVAIWGFVPYFFTLPVLVQVFPDGRLPSPRWRLAFRGIIALACVVTLARMFAPVSADLAPGIENPLGIAGAEWLNFVTFGGALTLFFVGIPLGVISLGLRLRRAEGVERTRLQWLFLGALALLLGIVVPLESGPMSDGGFSLGLVALPVAIGIAMLRHGLFDVELTLNRTVVYGLLTGFVVGLYALVVYGVQLLAPGSRWGILLVAAAALVAAVARDRVQLVVDRTLFGHRHNAYAVVSQVGRGVAAASQPVEALQRLVEGLRDALRLPYAAFSGGQISVAAGTPVHGSRVVTVRALGEAVGELHVGLRVPHERWTSQQEAAVEEVASRAGTLAYAAGLVTDVARSRGRIVAAREEERRRLRADLHDGVAPALAGTALQLESLARRLESTDPELARRAFELRDGLRAGVGELRAVVHGLRPPVLDQLGLAGALNQLVRGHDTPACTARVGALTDLPPAVEVAAYAIAAEAFGNALRHGVASRVEVSAGQARGEITVVVCDNGVGMPGRPVAGVGLRSIRDRAAEVGGRLDIGPTPGGGTTVRAVLPMEVA